MMTESLLVIKRRAELLGYLIDDGQRHSIGLKEQQVRLRRKAFVKPDRWNGNRKSEQQRKGRAA